MCSQWECAGAEGMQGIDILNSICVKCDWINHILGGGATRAKTGIDQIHKVGDINTTVERNTYYTGISKLDIPASYLELLLSFPICLLIQTLKSDTNGTRAASIQMQSN